MCSSCHKVKSGPYQVGPTLYEFYLLDSAVLKDKIDKVASDPNHGSVHVKLTREEWNCLHDFIKHAFGDRYSK